MIHVPDNNRNGSRAVGVLIVLPPSLCSSFTTVARTDIALLPFYYFAIFCPAMETHLYRSGGFALGVTWRKHMPPYRTAPQGVFDPWLARRAPRDRCPPRGKTSTSSAVWHDSAGRLMHNLFKLN